MSRTMRANRQKKSKPVESVYKLSFNTDDLTSIVEMFGVQREVVIQFGKKEHYDKHMELWERTFKKLPKHAKIGMAYSSSNAHIYSKWLSSAESEILLQYAKRLTTMPLEREV
jgi:hypothetical protein